MSAEADVAELPQLYAGRCILIPSGPSGDHLFFIVFDAKIIDGKEQVLLAPLCSVDASGKHDSTCLLVAGEHAFVEHPSYISYREVRAEPVQAVLRHLGSRYFKPHKDCSAGLLQRIAQGLEDSNRTPRFVKKDWLD